MNELKITFRFRRKLSGLWVVVLFQDGRPRAEHYAEALQTCRAWARRMWETR